MPPPKDRPTRFSPRLGSLEDVFRKVERTVHEPKPSVLLSVQLLELLPGYGHVFQLLELLAGYGNQLCQASSWTKKTLKVWVRSKVTRSQLRKDRSTGTCGTSELPAEFRFDRRQSGDRLSTLTEGSI